MKVALIIGISGQDGAYLAKSLLGKGYTVVGTSRDAEMASFRNLEILGIRGQVKVESTAVNDFRSVIQTVSRVKPDEIYNFAGQSSVGLSFQQPVETLESISLGCLNILESIRFLGSPIRFYNAGSMECFGNTGEVRADENSPFHPRSPYAVAKAAAHWQIVNYREAYGIFCCSGILSNHESPLRPPRFVTRKIVSAAVRISKGSNETLRLGNISIQRDWGWAPEYVEAMWLMLQLNEPEDFVIATGETNPLKEFTAEAFRCVGLNWQDHVVSDQSLLRPSDIAVGCANPARAAARLKWRAQHKMRDVIRMMIEGEEQLAAHSTLAP